LSELLGGILHQVKSTTAHPTTGHESNALLQRHLYRLPIHFCAGFHFCVSHALDTLYARRTNLSTASEPSGLFDSQRENTLLQRDADIPTRYCGAHQPTVWATRSTGPAINERIYSPRVNIQANHSNRPRASTLLFFALRLLTHHGDNTRVPHCPCSPHPSLGRLYNVSHPPNVRAKPRQMFSRAPRRCRLVIHGTTI
jgi:hypothetical protein